MNIENTLLFTDKFNYVRRTTTFFTSNQYTNPNFFFLKNTNRQLANVDLYL